MKTNTLKAAAAVGLSALALGSAAAQSVSKPVGYETLSMQVGYNYVGIRLHEAPVVTNTSISTSAEVVTVVDGVADALVDGSSYVFEVTDGDAVGAVVTVAGFDAAADTITLSDNLSGNFEDGDGFTIRPASTLATIFGAENSAGLSEGTGNPVGADQVLVPNGSGGFDKYYYDSENFNTFEASWTLVGDGVTEVDPEEVELIYTDGIVILVDSAPKSFVVSGSVKLTPTSYSVVTGYNYLSTVSPVGGTLETLFGATNTAGLATGRGNPVGADQVLIPTSAGFEKYYYDIENFNSFEASWTLVSDGQTEVDPATVSIDDASGYILLIDDSTVMVDASVPTFYSSL